MLQRTILNQCFWSPRSAWPGGCRPAVASVCLKAAKPTSEMGDPQYGRWLLRRWRETTSLTSGPTELTIGFSTTSASPEGTASGSSILRLQHGCQIWPGRAIAREPLVRERHRFQSRCRANRIRICGQGYEVDSNRFPQGKRVAAHPMGREHVPERSFRKFTTCLVIGNHDSRFGAGEAPLPHLFFAEPPIRQFSFLEIHRSHSYSACVTRMSVTDHSILCLCCSSLDHGPAERYVHAAVQFGLRYVARIDLCAVNVTVSSSNNSKRGCVRGGAGSARCGKFPASVRNLLAALLAVSGIRM